MIPRSYPTLSPDHRTRATFDRIFDAIDQLQRQPPSNGGGGGSRLSPADVALIIGQIQTSGGRGIGAFAQPLIGDTTGDPLLTAVAQAPGSGTVTILTVNDTVSALALTVTNPTTTPQLNFSGNLVAGVYTPTLTNVANLDASTAFQCQYLRVDTVVVVSGKVAVDPTAAGNTQLGISLPVASNFAAQEDCGGAAFASQIAGQGAAIRGDAANNRAEMVWVAVDTSNQSMYFTFAYRVI